MEKSEWIKWEGGECPELHQTGVEYETRRGNLGLGVAGDLRWEHLSFGGDIVAYRVLEEAAKPVSPEDIGPAATSKPVKSDGGSSDYYKISVKLPQELYDANGNLVTDVIFETQDLLYAMFYGEWSCSNVGKAARRIAESLQGRGKEGTSIAYDAKKIIWFGEDILKRFGEGI